MTHYGLPVRSRTHHRCCDEKQSGKGTGIARMGATLFRQGPNEHERVGDSSS